MENVQSSTWIYGCMEDGSSIFLGIMTGPGAGGDNRELIWRERRELNLEALSKGNSDECNLHGTLDGSRDEHEVSR